MKNECFKNLITELQENRMEAFAISGKKRYYN